MILLYRSDPIGAALISKFSFRMCLLFYKGPDLILKLPHTNPDVFSSKKILRLFGSSGDN